MKSKSKVISKELIAFAYVQDEYTKTGDITVGLMPIFTPVIHECAGQLFDAALFASGVKERYDIAMRPIVAAGLLPKLVEAGLLIKEEQIGHVAVYRCSGVNEVISHADTDVDQMLDAFCKYAEEALLQRNIVPSKEDLKTGFVQRLMDMQFLHEFNGARSPIKIAEEKGGVDERSEEDKLTLALDILSAEYIIFLSKDKPLQFEFLLKMAAGALIADVVLTLQQPASLTDLSNLTVVLDSPLIMDILNLNTVEHKQFGQDLLEMMKAARVNLITYKHIVDEVRASIKAPLNAYVNGEDAYGPLAMRFRQTPAHATYARAVMESLEDFIRHLDIEIIDAEEYTSTDYMVYCPEALEDTIRNCLGPLHERIEPRITDAKSISSVIRMRKGSVSKASVIDAKIIFVSRNDQLVWRTTACLHANKIMGADDVPPSILDRQLAVILWLCLGGSGNILTRDKLLANCMDALYPRPNLLDAVRRFVESIDHDKGQVFSALMRDRRAQSCLMHKTLGYARAVTQDNVSELLQELQRSTAAEVDEEARRRERELSEMHAKAMGIKAAALSFAEKTTETLIKEKAEIEKSNTQLVCTTLERACRSARAVRKRLAMLAILAYAILVILATYFSNSFVGLGAAIPCGIVAAFGFWFVPERVLKKWLDDAWEAKFNDEILESNVMEYEELYHLDRELCSARKKELQ